MSEDATELLRDMNLLRVELTDVINKSFRIGNIARIKTEENEKRILALELQQTEQPKSLWSLVFSEKFLVILAVGLMFALSAFSLIIIADTKGSDTHKKILENVEF